MVKLPFVFLCSLALYSCSLGTRKNQGDLRELFKRNEVDKALELLESSEIKSEEENRLLYLFQKGRLLRAQERYQAAADTFVQAGELIDKLYTKSVREALLTSISNDNNSTYYGSPYERSLMHYYQALSFLDIYQRGSLLEKVETKTKGKDGKEKIETSYVERSLEEQERRRYLFRARASIVAWDTFYKELQRSSRESTRFDHDLFAKILGGKIHEYIGARQDRQIALQLYKDAYQILKKDGPAFKSFNSDFQQYGKKLKGENIEGKALNPTAQYEELELFLQGKIKEKGRTKKNVTILYESGLVAPLEGEDFSYNLRSAIENVEDPTAKAFIAGVGLPVLTYFAMGPLGLASVSHTGNARLYVRHGVGEAMTAEAGIEFEMPVIKEPTPAATPKISIFKKGDKSQTALFTKNMVLAGPVSDLAYQMNLERISNSFSARGARIAIKHVLAIIAAYKTYENMSRAAGSELFAKPAALAQYLVSAKAIKESERADIRQWNVLPSEVFLSELELDPGDYIIKLEPSAKDKKPIELGGFSVKEGSSQAIFSFFNP